MKNLNIALGLNATFSLVCGISLILFSRNIANLFGTAQIAPFWQLGIGLTLFSINLFYIQRQTDKKRTHLLVISSLDIIWVLASILVIYLKPLGLNATGYNVIGVVAVIVSWFAFHQLYALANAESRSEDVAQNA